MAVIHGIVNINKPTGYTSSDVVVIVKGILKVAFGEKNFKVGHLGTLDPLGTGVLPISVGHATKLFDFFQKTPKIYKAGLLLNSQTDTLDTSGKVIATSDISPTLEELESALSPFRGEIMQIPPQFSALSVNGQRAYDIARRGESVELAARKVTIYNLILVEQKSPFEFELLIECSSGTYIRSLMRDIAAQLGGVGLMSYIHRIKAHNFTIEDSVTLDDFRSSPLAHLTGIDVALGELPRLEFSELQNARFRCGAEVLADNLVMQLGEIFACVYKNEIIGLATIEDGKIISSVRLYDNRL